MSEASKEVKHWQLIKKILEKTVHGGGQERQYVHRDEQEKHEEMKDSDSKGV